MERLTILGPWNNSSNLNQPQVFVDYSIKSCVDVTGQPGLNLPTDPNVCVFEITCESGIADLIEANATYLVLTRETISATAPP